MSISSEDDFPPGPDNYDLQASSGFKASNPSAFVASPNEGAAKAANPSAFGASPNEVGIKFDMEGSGAPKQLSVPPAQSSPLSYRNDAKVPAPQVPMASVLVGPKAGISQQPPGAKQPDNIGSGLSMNLKPPTLYSEPPKSQLAESPAFGVKANAAPASISFQQPASQQQANPSNTPVQIYQAQQASPYQPVSTSVPYQPPSNTDKNAAPKQEASKELNPDEASLDDKVLYVKVRIWWFVMLGCIGFLLIMIIGCTATPRWVYQADSSRTLQGGLLVCTKCPGDTDGMSYASIISDDRFCSNSNLNGFCDTIKDLQGAGGAFLAFTLITVVVLLIWTVYFVLELMEKKFPGPKWIPYLFPSLALLFNFIAIASWGGASQAKFESKDDCDVISEGSKEDICATDGPGLMLFIFLFIVLFSGFFAVLYFLKSRGKGGKGKEEEKASEKPAKEAPKNVDRI